MIEELDQISKKYYYDSISNLISLLVGTVMFITAIVAYYFDNIPYYLYPIAIGGYAIFSCELYIRYKSLRRLSVAYKL